MQRRKNIMKLIAAPGVVALALLATTLGQSAKAAEWDKQTLVTVERSAVKIQGTVLEPGQYVLKLSDSPSNRQIVQVFNGDETELLTTILANVAYRLQPTGDTKLTFAEGPTGGPPAIRTWFYPGDNYGLQFSER
jgi:hypothetical protein